MVGIIDYGVGNLFSLRSSLASVGAEAIVSSDISVLEKADKLILPGVGAFGDASDKLYESGLDSFILSQVEKGKPLLGICLGMQLLFEESHEYGIHKGLGLLKGKIVGMEGRIPQGLKIPHIGWNALQIERESKILSGVQSGECVYFVHSFFAQGCEDSLVATADYGMDITAAVEKGNIMGCQFHPEKSGAVGQRILSAFAKSCSSKENLQ